MKYIVALFLPLAVFAVHAADVPKNPPGIHVTHRSTPTMPLLEQGYSALRKNLLPQARTAYTQALAIDPKNIDGLCGLAVIALREDRPDIAERHYRQILVLDPRNANAVAALSNLRGQLDETRLKLLIAENPDNAALYFALGNMHAREQHWHEAQKAWFSAYINDATNPDIAFNLAVGLDHIGQSNLAAQYYAEALRLADGNRGSFMRTTAQARLRTFGDE